MFYIGCPMWGYKDWVGVDRLFPPRTPASEFLRLYSKKLTTVEGNTTFYSVPSADTVARWREQTPATFHICPKVSRDISHATRLDESRDATLFFVERMRGLGTRLGPTFLQLPPTFTPAQMTQLQAFLDFWPSDVRLAVEVRHPTFFHAPHSQTLNTLLSHHKVARVMLDTRPIRTGPTQEQEILQARERKPDLPLELTLTTDFVFLRYIGHPRAESNTEFLDSWARQLGQWYTQGHTLYVFCHCPFEEHSPDICAELYRKVTPLVPLPPLPWLAEPNDAEPKQARLF
jgi:uncharacterized protein YecE (DUF72 family)